MTPSCRSMLQLAGTGLTTAALGATGLAREQLPDEANTEALTLMRKRINWELNVINIDLDHQIFLYVGSNYNIEIK